jgi:hypothetical protein
LSDGKPYALRRSAGCNPGIKLDGVVERLIGGSVRLIAMVQLIVPAVDCGAH